MCVCVYMYIYSISFFKIHFSGYIDTRYLFQILFHYSN